MECAVYKKLLNGFQKVGVLYFLRMEGVVYTELLGGVVMLQLRSLSRMGLTSTWETKWVSLKSHKMFYVSCKTTLESVSPKYLEHLRASLLFMLIQYFQTSLEKYYLSFLGCNWHEGVKLNENPNFVFYHFIFVFRKVDVLCTSRPKAAVVKWWLNSSKQRSRSMNRQWWACFPSII